MRKLTIIESPLSSRNGRTMEENLTYLRACLRDSWARGELPFASHGYFPFFLNEHDPAERQAGIEAGYQFWFMHPVDAFGEPLYDGRMPTIVFYIDHGISEGMQLALDRARELIGEVGIEMRTLNPAATKQGGPK